MLLGDSKYIMTEANDIIEDFQTTSNKLIADILVESIESLNLPSRPTPTNSNKKSSTLTFGQINYLSSTEVSRSDKVKFLKVEIQNDVDISESLFEYDSTLNFAITINEETVKKSVEIDLMRSLKIIHTKRVMKTIRKIQTFIKSAKDLVSTNLAIINSAQKKNCKSVSNLCQKTKKKSSILKSIVKSIRVLNKKNKKCEIKLQKVILKKKKVVLNKTNKIRFLKKNDNHQ